MSNEKFTTSVPDSWKAAEKYKDVLKQTAEPAGKADHDHPALSMAADAVKEQSPQLGEALGDLSQTGTTGGVGAIMAMSKAWEIYKSRVDAAASALSGLKMPDLTQALNQTKEMGERWTGIADAIKKANDEFNSIENHNKRDKAADQKEHDRNKKALQLQKQQELADLDLKKGTMTRAQYELAKVDVENSYLAREGAEDQRFEQQKLSRKEQYQQDLDRQGTKDATQADDMKLPKTQARFDAEKKALEERAKTLGETAEEHSQLAKSAPDMNWQDFKKNYGWGTSREDFITQQEKKAADFADQQAGVQAEIDRREQAWHEKQKLQEKAAKEKGESTTIYDELYSREGDVQQFNADTQARHSNTQAQQQINATKAVGDATQYGQNLQAALDAVNGAHVENYTQIIQILHAQARAIQALGGQISHAGNIQNSG